VEVLQIKNRDCIFTAIAGVALARIWNQRDAVNTGGVDHFSSKLAGGDVDYHDTSGARDEQAVADGSKVR